MEVFALFKVTDTIMTGAGSASFGDMLTFHIGSERQSFLHHMLKRVGDIVLAVFLLIVLAPLMGVIAVLVCMMANRYSIARNAAQLVESGFSFINSVVCNRIRNM